MRGNHIYYKQWMGIGRQRLWRVGDGTSQSPFELVEVQKTYAAAAMKTWTLEISLANVVRPMAKRMVKPPIHTSFWSLESAAVVVSTAMAMVGTRQATMVDASEVALMTTETGTTAIPF